MNFILAMKAAKTHLVRREGYAQGVFLQIARDGEGGYLHFSSWLPTSTSDRNMRWIPGGHEKTWGLRMEDILADDWEIFSEEDLKQYGYGIQNKGLTPTTSLTDYKLT